MPHKTVYWFRKALRLHDNPALLAAYENSPQVLPIFILDPWFVKNYKVGENRWCFLRDSLLDLDKSFRQLNGRLFVIRGNPLEVLPLLFEDWKVTRLAFEVDTEPYALTRDAEVEKLCKKHNVELMKKISHTLYNSDRIIQKNGSSAPLTYQKFQQVAGQLGNPEKPCQTLSKDLAKDCTYVGDCPVSSCDVPSLEELGVDEGSLQETLYPGGETEALNRMDKYLKRTNWICSFEKPKTEPNNLEPSTTVLSPYLKFGCLSARTFYWKLKDIYTTTKKHTQPPVSLHGQLLWREFFYTVGYATPNFNKMEGNPVCRQIPWDTNSSHLEAWKQGRTGYPFIDAIMIQLRQEGWIHHLARHAVACFLTRGDLWISWEEGQKVFEELLLDADWYLNAANWMWLSASAFFHQYFRVYSPVAFGKKTDKDGLYIKKYLPVLKKIPAQYIYEPWKAPLTVQKAAGCIIGKDYPKPIVDHDKIRVVNIQRMKEAYAVTSKSQNDAKSPSKKRSVSDENTLDSPISKKQKAKTEKKPKPRKTAN